MIRERATGWWHRLIVADDEQSARYDRIDQELYAQEHPSCPACGGEWVDTEDGVVTRCWDSNCPTWDDIA
jgi:NAD-dependent DNA ligase